MIKVAYYVLTNNSISVYSYEVNTDLFGQMLLDFVLALKENI